MEMEKENSYQLSDNHSVAGAEVQNPSKGRKIRDGHTGHLEKQCLQFFCLAMSNCDYFIRHIDSYRMSIYNLIMTCLIVKKMRNNKF